MMLVLKDVNDKKLTPPSSPWPTFLVLGQFFYFRHDRYEHGIAYQVFQRCLCGYMFYAPLSDSMKMFEASEE